MLEKGVDDPRRRPSIPGRAALRAPGRRRAAGPLATALALWAAMHGVAALWAVTPSLPIELAYAVGDLAQDAVLAGLAGSVRDRGLDS